MSVIDRIEGHWRLVSFLEMTDNQDWRPALGASAKGFISYWPDGHMQVVIGAGERPRLRGDWSGISPEQKAECLDKLVAYAGSYSVEGEVVTHHVEVCWIPNWEGRDLKRAMSFPAPGQLQLATLPDDGPRARPAQRVLWERVE